jgi:hypothetical protein
MGKVKEVHKEFQMKEIKNHRPDFLQNSTIDNDKSETSSNTQPFMMSSGNPLMSPGEGIIALLNSLGYKSVLGVFNESTYIKVRTECEYPDGDIIDVFLPPFHISDICRISDLGETFRWVRTVIENEVSGEKFQQYFHEYTTINGIGSDIWLLEQSRTVLVSKVEITTDLPNQIMKFSEFIQNFSKYIYELNTGDIVSQTKRKTGKNVKKNDRC